MPNAKTTIISAGGDPMIIFLDAGKCGQAIESQNLMSASGWRVAECRRDCGSKASTLLLRPAE